MFSLREKCKRLRHERSGEQGWRRVRALAHLPPMWPGFDSLTRRHKWAEFVAPRGFSPGTLVSPLLKAQHLI